MTGQQTARYVHRDGRAYTFPEPPRVRPFRVVVVARGYRPGKLMLGRKPDHRGAHTRVELAEYAYISWTADVTAEPCREGYGSFCYAGALRAIAAVRAAFRDPRVRQVQIRTNQDRAVLVYNRHDDGRVTSYGETD